VQDGKAATLLVDGDGTILMASRDAAHLFGSRPEDLEGLRLEEILDAPRPSDFGAALGAALARICRGAAGSLHLRGALRERGGIIAPLDLHLSLAGVGPARPHGAAPVTVLVALRRAAAQAAAPAHASLTEAEPDPAALVQGGVIVEFSPSLLALLGLASGTLAGWPIGHLVAGEDLLPVIATLRGVEAGEERAASLGFHLARAGGLNPLEVVARARRVTRDGHPAVLLVLQDVSASVRTARRAIEALDRLESALGEAHEAVRGAEDTRLARDQLLRLHEEVRLANEGLESRLEDSERLNLNLRSLSEMKSRLMANVSHELQTPLVSIKGFTEMLLGRRLGEITVEQQEGLEVALRNINRLIGMIDGLLALARGEEKPALSLAIATVSLPEMVDEVVRLMEPDARRRNIRIQVAIPDGLNVQADRNQMMQVFVNLVSNAIKYNREGGEVAISASARHGESARVSIRDTGSGMTREQMERIFDRFYRTQEAAAGAPGTGLGLAIAREILARHGSLLRVESREQKGSTFSFTLAMPRKGESPVEDRRIEVTEDQRRED